MTTRAKIGIGILVMLLALGGFFGYRALTGNDKEHDTAVWTPSPDGKFSSKGDSSTAEPDDEGDMGGDKNPQSGDNQGQATNKDPSKGKPKAVPQGCMDTRTPIEGSRLKIDSMKVDIPLMSLGEDESGAPAAPPKSQGYAASWWKNGPAVGADQGRAIISIHTFRNGGALGNDLHSSKGMKQGDIVRFVDDKGNTQCYTLEKEIKVWVKDYDKQSDVLYSNTAPHRAVIVICWDFNWGTKDWDSRILYYLNPVA